MGGGSSTKSSAGRRGGVVYLVGGGPGDPGLLTLRGAECLRAADVVVYDRLANNVLLAFAAQAKLIDAGKQPDHHPVPQDEINRILIEEAREGKVVVRLKGGDPFVFGRGGEEAAALAEAGVRFEIIPGVTSAAAVPAYAGIPITQRGISSSVAFVTGHAADETVPAVNWHALAPAVDTLVILMGMQNLERIAASLAEAGLPPETPAAVISNGTLPEQRTIAGTLADIAAKAGDLEAPAIIIVGEVVRLHSLLDWFTPEAAPTGK